MAPFLYGFILSVLLDLLPKFSFAIEHVYFLRGYTISYGILLSMPNLFAKSRCDKVQYLCFLCASKFLMVKNYGTFQPVLRIQDVYPGSKFFSIPDPLSSVKKDSRSRTRILTKEFKYFNPKNK